MNEDKTITVNCLGDYCPVPMMKLKNYEKKLANGNTIKLITDHSCVCESVKNYCVTLKYNLDIVEPINGVWEIYIKS